jgi:membrane carboxypeptidase/penicillin-binding protein
VNYVRQQLEAKYGPDVLYRSGLQVYTTLDPKLQAIGERVAREQVKALASRQVSNAALVAMRPGTGELLAMVGSIDFFDTRIDGQVNVALRLRQPGSSIKPITYVAAFERGWTPATFIMDVETSFPDGANPDYRPVNYDNQFHGPVLLRSALANSYNIPAVKALQFVGIPRMLEVAHRLGVNSLNRSDYGLSLTLGGGDVTLLEMVGAYAAFANGGRRISPVAVLKLIDGEGHVIEDVQRQIEGNTVGLEVISPQHAYLITDILADNEARVPAFGTQSVLNLGRPAAVKTGTTNDWRDNWTIGYTPDLVTGVWVGNNDNTPMRGVSGVAGAAPIWHNFMEEALRDAPVRPFARPEGIIALEICANSGTLPGPACTQRRREVFVATQLPPGAEADLNRFVGIDVSTGQLATEFCPSNLVEQRFFFVLPPEYRAWAESNGYPQPPVERCTLHSSYVPSSMPFVTVVFTPEPTSLWPMPPTKSGPYATPWPLATLYPPYWPTPYWPTEEDTPEATY